MSGETSDPCSFGHDTLQQLYDRIVGNQNKPAYPQIIPQLYYAINDINSHADGDENMNEDDEMTGKLHHNIDHNIPIISYDEEESGAPIIHTGTKNLESLTAPIRYRIKTAKKIIENEIETSKSHQDWSRKALKSDVIVEANEDEKDGEYKNSNINNKFDFLPAKAENMGDVDMDADEKTSNNLKKNHIPIHILLKTELPDWEVKIKDLEQELQQKKEKLKTVKARISDILNEDS